MRKDITWLAFAAAVAGYALVATALAQQPQGTPEVQALSAKLMSELNAGLTCNAEVVRLHARIAELEAKKPEVKK